MKDESWKKMGHMISHKFQRGSICSCRWTQTHRPERGRKGGDGRVLEAFGRDEPNSNGKRLLPFASDNKPSPTNTTVGVRKGGKSQTSDGISSRNDQKRIDYTLTRQAHRCRVHDVKVHPQPPPRAAEDSDHNIVFAMVRLSGRFVPDRHESTKNKTIGLPTGRFFFI